jgi:hypothetical protein
VPLLHQRVREPPPDRRVDERRAAPREAALRLQPDEWRAGHALDAAGERQVGLAERDEPAGLVDRLEPGRAQPVDRHPRHLDREPGEQPRHPRDVAVVLTGLVGRAHDDLLDGAGLEAGARDGRLDRARGEVVRADARERSGVAADRGAHRVDDQRFGHRAILSTSAWS